MMHFSDRSEQKSCDCLCELLQTTKFKHLRSIKGIEEVISNWSCRSTRSIPRFFEWSFYYSISNNSNDGRRPRLRQEPSNKFTRMVLIFHLSLILKGHKVSMYGQIHNLYKPRQVHHQLFLVIRAS